MKTITLKIKGMHCLSCEMLIEDALDDIGAKRAKADKDSGTVRVEYDENNLDKNDIVKTISDEGYQVIEDGE